MNESTPKQAKGQGGASARNRYGQLEIRFPKTEDSPLDTTFHACGRVQFDQPPPPPDHFFVDAVLSNGVHTYVGTPPAQETADWEFLFEDVEETSDTNPHYVLTVILNQDGEAVGELVNDLAVRGAHGANQVVIEKVNNVSPPGDGSPVPVPRQFPISGTCRRTARVSAVIRYQAAERQNKKRVYGRPPVRNGPDWHFSFNLPRDLPDGVHEVHVITDRRCGHEKATVRIRLGT